MILNERIRQLRIINRLTAKEFGDIFNISHSSVSLYESGKRTPNIDLVIRIAKYFNVSTDYLLGITDIPYFVSPDYNKDINYDIAKNIEIIVNQIDIRDNILFNGMLVDAKFTKIFKRSIQCLIETFYFMRKSI